MAPTANRLRHLIREEKDDVWEDVALKFRVPLKGGRQLPSRVLSPFVFCSETERKQVEKAILKRLDSTQVDVLVKRGNWDIFMREFNRLRRVKELVVKSRGKQNARASVPG